MRLFSRLYERVMNWAGHRHAPYYLAGLAFAESSFFPVPPDVMLAPMALGNPRRAWFFAALTTVASGIGGIAGYFLGMFAFEFIQPVLHDYGYWDAFLRVKSWFGEWGFWAILIAGFTPVPYKVFTIAAGVTSMALLPFVLGSLIGRGARFFLVAALMVWGGERMEATLRAYIDRVGWIALIAVIIAWLTLRGG